MLLTSHYMADVTALCAARAGDRPRTVDLRRRAARAGRARGTVQADAPDAARARGRRGPGAAGAGRLGGAGLTVTLRVPRGESAAWPGGRWPSCRSRISPSRSRRWSRSSARSFVAGRRMPKLARAYAALIRAGLLGELEYRAQALLWLLLAIVPLIMMNVWLALVDQAGPAGGWRRADFIAYYVAVARSTSSPRPTPVGSGAARCAAATSRPACSSRSRPSTTTSASTSAASCSARR